MSASPIRVAIIGGGISGLSAGWLLSHSQDYSGEGEETMKRSKKYEVTLFEKCNAIGMDANSIDYSSSEDPSLSNHRGKFHSSRTILFALFIERR